MGTMVQEPHISYARVMTSFVLPSISIGAMPRSTKKRSPEALCPLGPASRPAACQLQPGTCKAGSAAPRSASSASSSPTLCLCCSSRDCSCGLPASPGSEHPARSIYRPWFSPYSYFMHTHGATPQDPNSLSYCMPSPTKESDDPDDLSEIICSSSGSSDKTQPPERDKQARDTARITVRDILAVSQQQPVPQCGYQCMSCCRIFPTLWSMKIHIQQSSREGYSCKVYYRRLKALWEKEHKEQEACSPQGACVSPPAGQPPREGTAPSLLPAAK
ncbi:PREDICTED: uncharacterized protein C1orf111 homolog isoform X2 [Calidris pugnax]|uniref:uncharacterized protein C1orf111 homolog isoform X2 n=1 Tax=Calidris pugnax TaxID=198806 RepID=UPI00071D2E49|nr:PREDICTED: uncharacterized protein C1orf111 homolog isoform X2 [Calidris pugnax]